MHPADVSDAPAPDPPELPLLREPADGVPPQIVTHPQVIDAARRIALGSGPVAVDAERASGYRYSQRAYLVQLRREGTGTLLVDPIEVPDLAELNTAIGDAEWILHAANQDLPCLADVGLVPTRLFDTELAGRLLGQERVALGTMVEQYLGVRLEKQHSAADWSTRPLPQDWLVYAALDVELLIGLRAELARVLADAGKSEWAAQEFEAVRLAPIPPPREEPWRRTSGIHGIRNRRQLAAVRGLWRARDQLGSQRDVAPGRVLPDAAIIAAARSDPRTAEDLATLATFRGPRQRRQLARWFAALAQARALPEEELPALTGPADNVPLSSRWRDREPEAAARLIRCRAAVAVLAERHSVLAQNLLAGDVVRRVAWQPPDPLEPDTVAATLAAAGARPWQVELTAASLAEALAAVAEE